MSTLARRSADLKKISDVGRDYDRAGERYRVYADGNTEKLYKFDSQYAYGDQETWGVVENALHRLRLKGTRELSVLDLGCGPGTWLRRVVDRAVQMGFTKITARGIDLAEEQVLRAQFLSRNLARRGSVSISFEVGDIRNPFPEADRSVDICLCLYAVLNHLPVAALPAIFKEAARITKGVFVATVRAIGSTPTIYVDGVKAARAYHQDNARDLLEVEFQDGSKTSFSSHLFSAAQIKALSAADFEVEELSGLDLFHGRFATDPDWNPAEAAPDVALAHALRALENRFRKNPAFLDHATHLLLIARPKKV